MLFYPILYCYKLLQIIISIGTLSILILPFSGHYIDPNEYDEVQMEYSSIIILLTILSIIVAIMFNGFLTIKKIIDPYFKDY